MNDIETMATRDAAQSPVPGRSRLDLFLDLLLYGLPGLLLLAMILLVLTSTSPDIHSDSEFGQWLFDASSDIQRMQAWDLQDRLDLRKRSSRSYHHYRHHGSGLLSLQFDDILHELVLQRIAAGPDAQELQPLILLETAYFDGDNHNDDEELRDSILRQQAYRERSGLDALNQILLAADIFYEAYGKIDEHPADRQLANFNNFGPRFKDPGSWMPEEVYNELQDLLTEVPSLPADTPMAAYATAMRHINSGQHELAIPILSAANAMPMPDSRSFLLASLGLDDPAGMDAQTLAYLSQYGHGYQLLYRPHGAAIADFQEYCIVNQRLEGLQDLQQAIWRMAPLWSLEISVSFIQNMLSDIPQAVIQHPGNEAFRSAMLNVPLLSSSIHRARYSHHGTFPQENVRHVLADLELQLCSYRSGLYADDHFWFGNALYEWQVSAADMLTDQDRQILTELQELDWRMLVVDPDSLTGEVNEQ